jgi:GT2 family glycosyltransferase
MEPSVVVNIHSGTDLRQFSAAAESILAQDAPSFEFVIVVSDAPVIERHVTEHYGEHPVTTIVSLETDEGLSTARNAGAKAASGDIVVFTDEDVLAEPDWLSELVAVYARRNPIGVGGNVLPQWPTSKPWYFPEEFFWLVGVTHPNFVKRDEPQRVRNTFGCNISFRRASFLDAGGFREDLGKNQTNPLQGEEAELCERLDDEFWYTPDAVVHHRVDKNQLTVWYLLTRSFWQGYSKAALAKDMSGESSFLKEIMFDALPRRFRRPSREHLGEAAAICLFTVTVGLGYSYGKVS